MTTTPKTLRSRNLTAARRSLKLIADAVTEHRAALEDGVVPGDDFLASVFKYEAARTRLGALDALGEDGGDDSPETVEVQREGLAALIELLRMSEVGYVIQDAGENSVLGQILATTGTGEPAEQQS